MRKALESIWQSVKKAKDIYSKFDDIEIDISREKEEEFSLKFKKMYNEIKAKYMDESVKNLDRHKVAAIIICTLIDTEIIRSKKQMEDGCVFLGAEMIALSIGLSYMQRSLSNILIEKNILNIITSYHMPKAFSCNTNYFDIFARNLYFSRKDYTINPLDISEKLFLLEYITLLKEGIDPLKLKVDNQNI